MKGRAQAAIEYLFMVALSLVIVLMVFRALTQVANNAAEHTARVSEKLENEIEEVIEEG